MQIEHSKIPAIQSLEQFCRSIPIDNTTAWRWRKKGWLQTTNIAGRQYVTMEQVLQFLRRVESGEFSKKHVVPPREVVAA